MMQLLDETHVSDKGNSLRITIPRIIREKLALKNGEILGFYEEDGMIIIKKIK